MAEQDDGRERAELTVRRCEHCGGSIPSRRKDARFCSTSHRVMAHRKAKREREIHESLVTRGLTDLVAFHERAAPPAHWADDPRQYSDFGDLPGDAELAAEFDDEHQGDERTRHFRTLVQEDAERTPRETWRRWRSHGRRHGTEHPEQAADRITRHRTADAAKTARIDRSTGGRIQDRFDTRTAVNVADNARQSRALNRGYVEQPPMSSPGFDFGESFDGGPYRGGRPGSVFGSDAEVYAKSQVARRMYSSNPYNSDGFRF